MNAGKTRNENGRIQHLFKEAVLTALIGIPVFFSMVFTTKLGGFNVLNFYSEDVFPPVPVYLGDFSLTFSSRLLIGTVTKLFSYQYTIEQLYFICGAVSVIAICVSALICGALLKTAIRNRNFLMLFIGILLVFNPLIPQTNYMIYGSFDTYWIIIFGATLFFCRDRTYFVAVPLLSIIAVMVHYGYLISYFPPLMALLVYEFVYSRKRAVKIASGISFGVSAVGTVGLTVWSLSGATELLSMTAQQFHEYLYSRLSISDAKLSYYEKLQGGNLFPFEFFEGYFFSGNEVETAAGTDIKLIIERFIHYYLKDVQVKTVIQYILACLPFLVFFTVLWVLCIKKVSGIKKLPYLLFILSEIAVFICVFISTDFWRWLTAIMLTQSSLLLVLVRKNDEALCEIISAPLVKKRWFKTVVIVLGVLFIGYCMWFGRDLPTVNTTWEM